MLAFDTALAHNLDALDTYQRRDGNIGCTSSIYKVHTEARYDNEH